MPNEESGQIVTVEECRRCGQKNVTGIQWYWEGNCEFKCDYCGKTMHMGYDEQSNVEQMRMIEERNRALENRARYEREKDVEFGENYAKAIEDMESPPDVKEHFKHLTEGVKFPRQETFAKPGGFDSIDKPLILPK